MAGDVTIAIPGGEQSLRGYDTDAGIDEYVRAGHVFPVRQLGALYTLRNQRFLATTGYVECTLNATGEKIAMIRNPVGSGKVVVFDQAEFGATNNVRFSRYGGGTLSLVGSPTPRPAARSSGLSTGDAAVLEIYRGGTAGFEFNVTAGGTLRKVATMLAFDTYQILGINGTIVLQPGSVGYWLTDEAPGGGGGAYQTFIDFEWWEIDTATYALMQAAAAAQQLY